MHSMGLLFRRCEVKHRLQIELLRSGMNKENRNLLFVDNNMTMPATGKLLYLCYSSAFWRLLITI